MDKIRNAAIILIGLGDKCTGEILKNMSPKEVRSILEAINTIDSVSEEDVNSALTEFFQESSNNSGINASSKEQIKNSILQAVGNKGLGDIIQGIDSEKDRWLDLVKMQPVGALVDLIQDEHPQIVTSIVIIIFNYISSDFGSKVIKQLPKGIQAQVFRRMTALGAISKTAVDVLGNYFENQFQDTRKEQHDHARWSRNSSQYYFVPR